MNKALVPLFATLALVALGGCEIGPVIVPATGHGPGALALPSNGTTSNSPAGPIVINGLAANPTNIATKNDKITFSVNAFDSNGQPMQYSWSSTKGTLSATEGQTVYWSPLNSTGSLDQGIATVQVLITDSTGATKQAAVNLQISPDGITQTVPTSATTTTTTTTSTGV